jgi:GrpB-like predicted nucleotidyltransferase (UPF0157 family)
MDDEQLKAVTVGDLPPEYQQIVIAEYDPIWPHWYESAAYRIREALGDKVLQLDHVGSTSVPEIAAKPIIDMAATIRSYDDAAAIAAALRAPGWSWAPEPDDDELRRASFCFPEPGYRTHHLHAIEARSPHWRRWLAFRDALRDDVRLARQYAALKQRLAQQFAHDRDSYRAGKTAFVVHTLGAGEPRGPSR